MLRRYTLGMLCASVFLAPWPASAAPGATVTMVRSTGIRKAVFPLTAGEIVVYLPEDLRAGDQISGSISVLPRGPAQRHPEQLRALEAHKVALGPAVAGVRERRYRAQLPANAATVTLALLNPRGAWLGGTTVPLGAPQGAPSGFAAPPLFLAGRPVAISGPFDGDMANTTCRLGAIPITPLAESPRHCVLAAPPQLTGPVQLQLQEGAAMHLASCRSLALELTAPQLVLRGGEQTELEVRVSGLQGAPPPLFPLSVRIASLTPREAVQWVGGPLLSLPITPAVVDGRGEFRYRTLVRSRRRCVLDFAAALPAQSPEYLDLSRVPMQLAGPALANRFAGMSDEELLAEMERLAQAAEAALRAGDESRFERLVQEFEKARREWKARGR